MVYENRSLELGDKGGTHTDNTVKAKAELLSNLPALILNHARQKERLRTEKQADRRSVLQRDTIPTSQINKGWSGPSPYSITPVTIAYFCFSPGFYLAPTHLPKPPHMTERIRWTSQIATFHGYIKWYAEKAHGAIFWICGSLGQYSHWESYVYSKMGYASA